MRVRRQLTSVELATSLKVDIVVTVEEPVPWPSRLPREREGLRRRKTLGDDQMRRAVRRKHRVLALVAATVDVEIEAVQVHRVDGRAGVDDAHAHRVARSVRQSFGVRPGSSVDHEPKDAAWRAGQHPVAPTADEKYSIGRRLTAARIHDECAGERRVRSRALAQGRASR